jgi:hypothetical protein
MATTNPKNSPPTILKQERLKGRPICPPHVPVLRFSPVAWAKLLYMRDFGETEVGGFGISVAGDPLLIVDVEFVKQTCTAVSVVFDDAAVAEFFDRQVDRGLRPEQFARVWVHTHPGRCPQPSVVDEKTFARVFGRSDWALMFILAQGGKSYSRLRFNIGPGGALETNAEVDFSRPFPASTEAAWAAEYRENVFWPAPRNSSDAAYGRDEVPCAHDNWFYVRDEPLVDEPATDFLLPTINRIPTLYD